MFLVPIRQFSNTLARFYFVHFHVDLQTGDNSFHGEPIPERCGMITAQLYTSDSRLIGRTRRSRVPSKCDEARNPAILPCRL